MSHGLSDGSAARLRLVSQTSDLLPAHSPPKTGGRGNQPSHVPLTDHTRLRPQWADAHPWLISATVIVSLGSAMWTGSRWATYSSSWVRLDWRSRWDFWACSSCDRAHVTQP